MEKTDQHPDSERFEVNLACDASEVRLSGFNGLVTVAFRRFDDFDRGISFSGIAG